MCIYSGVKAQKFHANKRPKEDLKHIHETIENIRRIKPKKLILISTIDVLDRTQIVNEDYMIESKNLMPYGKNRRILEEWVIKNIKNYHIVRLPALYGINLKKNFLYDLLNPIPNMLSKEIYLRYGQNSSIVLQSYEINKDNFYYLKEDLSFNNRQNLLKAFKNQNFTSLHLTDSRAEFQFYPLSRLKQDLSCVIKYSIPCINLVTEPVKASEVFKFLFEDTFTNEISQNFPKYNIKTKYSKLWGRFDGYLMEKNEVLKDIKLYLDAYHD